VWTNDIGKYSVGQRVEDLEDTSVCGIIAAIRPDAGPVGGTDGPGTIFVEELQLEPATPTTAGLLAPVKEDEEMLNSAERSIQRWRIDFADLEMRAMIGSGAQGVVFKGSYCKVSSSMTIAQTGCCTTADQSTQH
jgi:hypothetical protein